jgi:hypothetical protein
MFVIVTARKLLLGRGSNDRVGGLLFIRSVTSLLVGDATGR